MFATKEDAENWIRCSKDEYWDAVNGGDNIVRTERDQTIWQTRYSQPVAKSSVGYIPHAELEVFYVWQSRYASNQYKTALAQAYGESQE